MRPINRSVSLESQGLVRASRMNRRLARLISRRQAGFVKRGCSANDADASESLRYLQRTGCSIWATAGIAASGKTTKLEVICER
jgi:hypothetical protein